MFYKFVRAHKYLQIYLYLLNIILRDVDAFLEQANFIDDKEAVLADADDQIKAVNFDLDCMLKELSEADSIEREIESALSAYEGLLMRHFEELTRYSNLNHRFDLLYIHYNLIEHFLFLFLQINNLFIYVLSHINKIISYSGTEKDLDDSSSPSLQSLNIEVSSNYRTLSELIRQVGDDKSAMEEIIDAYKDCKVEKVKEKS